MKRLLISCAMALPLLALRPARRCAEVKTREKSQVKIEGMIGRMVNMFGGKAAKEGVVSTVAVKGNRKATMNDSTGQIIDLSEEKIYDLDMKKKTYEVTTFEELRRRMREAREKAQKDAEKEPGQEPEKQRRAAEGVRGRLRRQGNRPEEDARRLRHARGDHDDHGARKGQDARGRRRLRDDRRFVARPADCRVEGGRGVRRAVLEAAAGPRGDGHVGRADGDGRGDVPDDEAGVGAAGEGRREAARARRSRPRRRSRGCKSKEQMAQQAEREQVGGGGGLGGMLARKMAKKDDEDKPRATIFTAISETQEVATTVARGRHRSSGRLQGKEIVP